MYVCVPSFEWKPLINKANNWNFGRISNKTHVVALYLMLLFSLLFFSRSIVILMLCILILNENFSLQFLDDAYIEMRINLTKSNICVTNFLWSMNEKWEFEQKQINKKIQKKNIRMKWDEKINRKYTVCYLFTLLPQCFFFCFVSA